MNKISLILAESSLELIPKEIQNHPSVLSHCKKLSKTASRVLLDNSWHYAAMKGIENEMKRGRPDLVYFSMLEACSTPLYFEKKISVYVHTLNDKVIKVGEDVHLPKSYHRFAGLIEKLFYEKRIESEGNILLEMTDMSFPELVETINPKNVVGLKKIKTRSKKISVLYGGSVDEKNCSDFIKSEFIDGIFIGRAALKVNNFIKICKESLRT